MEKKFCPLINNECYGADCVFSDLPENNRCNLATAFKSITEFNDNNGVKRLLNLEQRIISGVNDISSIQGDVSTIESKITPKKKS